MYRNSYQDMSRCFTYLKKLEKYGEKETRVKQVHINTSKITIHWNAKDANYFKTLTCTFHVNHSSI